MANEVDEFLAGLDSQPKDDPFKPESEDPFATEEVETKEEEKEEKPIPYHKDPKVQRFIEKELDKRMANIKPTEVEKFIKEEVKDEDDLVTAFQNIIGNDTPEKVHALKMLGKKLKDVEENSSQKALQRIQEQQDEERGEELKAQEELVQAFDDIEEEFDVDLTSNTPAAKKTRNDFVDFIQLIAPKDENGQVVQFPDFQNAFRLFKERTPKDSNSRAKELSSRSMQRSSDASSAPKSMDKSWKEVDRIFGNLSN